MALRGKRTEDLKISCTANLKKKNFGFLDFVKKKKLFEKKMFILKVVSSVLCFKSFINVFVLKREIERERKFPVYLPCGDSNQERFC